MSDWRQRDIERRHPHVRWVSRALVAGAIVFAATVIGGVAYFKYWVLLNHPETFAWLHLIGVF